MFIYYLKLYNYLNINRMLSIFYFFIHYNKEHKLFENAVTKNTNNLVIRQGGISKQLFAKNNNNVGQCFLRTLIPFILK